MRSRFGLMCAVAGALMGLACASATVKVMPPLAYKAPSMDFSLIKTLVVFPLFPSGQEDQQFSGTFISTLENELTNRQSQWHLVPCQEVLQLINDHGLGTGYKNLQADYNTPGTEIGKFILTPATKDFLTKLQGITKAEGFLMGTYAMTEVQLPGGGLLMKLAMPKTRVCIRMSLWYGKGNRAWWMAKIDQPLGALKNQEQLIQEMAASIASGIGKGTLLQL